MQGERYTGTTELSFNNTPTEIAHMSEENLKDTSTKLAQQMVEDDKKAEEALREIAHPVISDEHRQMFDHLVNGDHMALIPCTLDGKPSSALCSVKRVPEDGNIYVLPLFVPVTEEMKLKLPTKEEMAALSSSANAPSVAVMPTLPTATERPMMSFTPELARRLQRNYDSAVANARESFLFEGHDMLTSYAKYLLEYLRGQNVLT